MSTDPLDRVIEVAMLAADPAVLDVPFHSRTRDIRTAVTEAFRCAVRNGLLEVVPSERWPQLVALEPPYLRATLTSPDGA